jgi:hypothetical protein
MMAGATRIVQWREQGVVHTAVVRRHNGRSALQYVRTTRVNQRDLPSAETDWDVTAEQLPATAALDLGVESQHSDRSTSHGEPDATEATQ